MSHRRTITLAALVLLPALLAGCRDSTKPRDTSAPAAPRGLVSVTGDHEVYLSWYANTESDVTTYRIYESACADGPGCPYDRIGSTAGTQFRVTGLSNGVTRYFAVTAVDRAGNESDLTYDHVFDTPRPEGFDVRLTDATVGPATAGWDFSSGVVRAFDAENVDVYYQTSNGVDRMVAPFTDTDIQDAGYATTLDAIDFAPTAGWSPSGAVELVLGHAYVVWTHDDHYAKFRVTRISGGSIDMDWAYQVDPGNRELRARPTPREGSRTRRSAVPVP